MTRSNVHPLFALPFLLFGAMIGYNIANIHNDNARILEKRLYMTSSALGAKFVNCEPKDFGFTKSITCTSLIDEANSNNIIKQAEVKYKELFSNGYECDSSASSSCEAIGKEYSGKIANVPFTLYVMNKDKSDSAGNALLLQEQYNIWRGP